MARQDWYDRDEEARRAARRRDRDDFGQADYTRDYGYDPDSRSGYRADGRRHEVYDFGQADDPDDFLYDANGRPVRRRHADDARYGEGARYYDAAGRENERDPENRSWTERAGDFLAGRRRADGYERGPRRPSDRALWEVITGRLAREPHLDLSDVDVRVEDREVILEGRVRHKADKRRIEDIADIDGVRHVQNNLRAHEHTHWTFL